MSVDPNKVKAVFLEVVEKLTPDAWDQFLNEACDNDSELRRQVEVLLDAHRRAGTYLEQGAIVGSTSETLPLITERPGTVIGPYKLLQEIGQGGMGVVFMAEQHEPVRRKVALKIIKPGMDTRQVIARFQAERQALTLMDHPNIARVLDAGTTESGRPYFVMELVKGQPITQYCDEQHLTPRQRLELLIPVCHAIQHAHQKGIIHRDIKPSNILIAEYDQQAVPKVIDFGVAKAIHQPLIEQTMFTGYGQIVGTLEYMSPEQAKVNQLDIDTRSDIYSLGVLLYELLTGSTPFNKQRLRSAAWDEMLRIIREEEPQRPSTRLSHSDTLPSIAANRRTEPKKLSTLVRGELDWIVMKALEKDRGRRYETASAFTADLQHYLNDEAVIACPASAAYRFQKFARRNRVAFTTAMLVLTAILLGTVVSTTQAIRAMRAEELAEGRLQTETEAHNQAEIARQAEAAQRQIADNALVNATRQSYVSLLNLAWKNWDDNRADGTRSLLESTKPEHTGGVDLRGWEWHYLWRLTHSARKTLNFSSGGPEVSVSLAFSPDGQLLVTGGDYGTLKMWDATGTHEVRTIKAHSDRIRRLSFNREGTQFVTGSIDGAVKLWETATVRELRSFPAPGSVKAQKGSYGMAVSPDGLHLAIASIANEITIWSTTSGKEIRTLQGHSDFVRVLAFSPDGQRLASGGDDATVRLWDATTGRELWLFSGHKTRINAIAFSPDGKILATGSSRGVLLDVATGRETKTFDGTESGFGCLAYNHDGSRLASSSGTTVKLWDPVSGRERQSFKGHTDGVTSVSFSSHGDLLASGSWDGTIFLWDEASGQGPWSLRHSGAVHSVSYSGDNKLLAVAGGGVIAVRDASTGLRLWEHLEVISSNVQFDPTSREVILGLANGHVQFRDARDGRELRTFKAHDGYIASLGYSPDGRVLATGGADKLVALWNPLDGRRLATLNGHTDAISAVAFSPDGGRVGSVGAGENDISLRLWDVPTGRGVRTTVLKLNIGTAKNYVRRMVFSRDGRWIFTAGHFSSLVWDVETGKPPQLENFFRLPNPNSDEDRVRSLSLSRDGRRLASGSSDGTVRIWDVATGQELRAIRTSTRISSIDFSPDGTRLAVGTQGGEVLVWDARPVTDELRAELNDIDRVETLFAENLVESLFDKNPLSTDVIEALKADTTLSESVRTKAIDRARSRPVNPVLLHNRSWSVVNQRGLPTDQYQSALRLAEAACKLGPDQTDYALFLRTLGIAQYRLGQYAEAVETLTRSDQLLAKSQWGHSPSNIATLAMAHFQLGHTDQARQHLEQLRQLMQSDQWKANEISRQYMEEALQLINRTPVEAERPVRRSSAGTGASDGKE